MDEAHRKQAAIEYRRLHEARRRLNDRLMNRLDRRQVEVAARTLGFWHEGILVFDSEEDSAVLFDFAIHATGEGGRNAPRGLLDDGALGLDDPILDAVACSDRGDRRGARAILHGLLERNLWRLGLFDETRDVFERILWYNPTDNQGVRFILPTLERREPWRDEDG